MGQASPSLSINTMIVFTPSPYPVLLFPSRFFSSESCRCWTIPSSSDAKLPYTYQHFSSGLDHLIVVLLHLADFQEGFRSKPVRFAFSQAREPIEHQEENNETHQNILNLANCYHWLNLYQKHKNQYGWTYLKSVYILLVYFLLFVLKSDGKA